MSIIVSFERYTPAARFDAVAWRTVKVEEAATSTGSWTLIDTLTLSPVDSDPSNPATRNLTTANGTALGLWYRLTWVDVNDDESEPTTPVQNVSPDSTLYVSADELKSALGLDATSYADNQIDIAVASASRAIDNACSNGFESPQRFFYTSTDTRYFTAESYATSIEIDDLTTLDTLEVDLSGAGTFTTWTDATDFTLAPRNAATMSRPYERVRLSRQMQTYWPMYDNAIKITGTFGWTAVPSEVRQFALVFAERLLYRVKHAPFGILTISGDIGTVARLARTDPDFDPLIGHLVRTRPFI